MNYAEMSDFEINHLVAKTSGVNIKCIMLDSDDNHSGVMVGRKNTREIREFNPCNSWGDAGPIIAQNKISVVFDCSDYCEAVSADDDVCCRCGDPFGNREQHENPLRAAMIVFLMIKDKEANNESH